MRNKVAPLLIHTLQGNLQTLAANIRMVSPTQFIFSWRNSPQWARASSLSRLHDHTQTHQTPYYCSGWVISPIQRPLPDNKQQSQEREIHPPAGFEPAIPASERPQTHALDRAASGIGLPTNAWTNPFGRWTETSFCPCIITQSTYHTHTQSNRKLASSSAPLHKQPIYEDLQNQR